MNIHSLTRDLSLLCIIVWLPLSFFSLASTSPDRISVVGKAPALLDESAPEPDSNTPILQHFYRLTIVNENRNTIATSASCKAGPMLDTTGNCGNPQEGYPKYDAPSGFNSSNLLAQETAEEAPTSKQLYEKARQHEKEKRYDEAIGIYEKLLEQDSDNTNYLFRLGRLYAWVHKWPQALDTLNKCLEIRPSHNDARLSLGYLYLWMGDIESSEKHFTIIINDKPEYHDAHVALARIEVRKGNLEKAKQILEEVVKQKPTHVDALNYLGTIYQRQRKYSKAKGYYTQVLEINPDDPVAEDRLYKTRFYTDPSFSFTSKFSREREKDKKTGERVVELSSFSNTLKLRFPISDKLLALATVVRRIQTEENVQRKKDNYDVNSNRLSLGLEGRITKHFTLKGSIAFKETSKRGQSIFPFQRELKVEPKIGAKFNKGNHYFSVAVFSDSFVAKDFAFKNSELLENKNVSLSYSYHFASNQIVGLNHNHRFINGRTENTERKTTFWFRRDIPHFEDLLFVTYSFKYRAFAKDVGEYYSFDRQLKHSLKVSMKKQFNISSRLEASFTKTWQRTFEKVNPDRISSDVVVVLGSEVEKSSNGNKVRISYSKRFGQSAKLELAGSYFWNSNDYEAFGLRAMFSWQF